MSSRLSYKVALGGVISSLSIICMFLTSVFPAMYLALPMISGGLLMVVVAEVNLSWAFLTYMSIGLLSVFVTPDKEAALIFIMFFGHYPILKQSIAKKGSAPLRLFFKLAAFNICIILNFRLTVYVLGYDEILEDIAEWGKYGLYILLGLSNLVFIMYDYTLSGYMNLYVRYFRPRFLKKR